jgi:hypothetical protein
MRGDFVKNNYTEMKLEPYPLCAGICVEDTPHQGLEDGIFGVKFLDPLSISKLIFRIIGAQTVP